MKTVMVTTIVRQELSVPDHATREDVLDFLAENQSFRTAFQGVTNAEGYEIVDLGVVEEDVELESEDEYDGQPDEAQEWHDFDPDC